jgi:hypothetical protein
VQILIIQKCFFKNGVYLQQTGYVRFSYVSCGIWVSRSSDYDNYCLLGLMQSKHSSETLVNVLPDYIHGITFQTTVIPTVSSAFLIYFSFQTFFILKYYVVSNVVGRSCNITCATIICANSSNHKQNLNWMTRKGLRTLNRILCLLTDFKQTIRSVHDSHFTFPAQCLTCCHYSQMWDFWLS